MPARSSVAAGQCAAKMAKKGGSCGRKMGGGGKRHANKDHRTLKRTINKGRWDDICANELRPERLPAVTKEKTALDPDLPGLGQYYCVCCRFASPRKSNPPGQISAPAFHGL